MSDFVTVEWLSETDIFQKHIKLLAGRSGLSQKVTFVTVQEAPDFYTMIDGGEFVLSTWYVFRDNLEGGLTALKNLSSSKASGVGIKVRRFIDEIPQSYIDYADEAGLPLFAVDGNANFRDIIKSITIEINMSQLNTAVQLNEYYDFLFKAALENGSADFMLEDFFKRTGLIAISVSTDFTGVRGQKNLRKLGERRERLESAKRLIKARPDEMEYFHEGDCHIFPCVARRFCYGFLIVLDQSELSAKQKLYISQLRNIITIKWLDRQERENDLLMSLLDMIIHSPEKNELSITEMLRQHSLDVSAGIRAAVLKLAEDRKDKMAMQKDAQRFLIAASSRIPDILSTWDRNGAYTMLIGNQGCPDMNTPPSWIADIARMLDKYASITIAVGPSVHRVMDIRTSIRLAANTHMFSNEKVSYYGDHLPKMGLMSGANSYECELFINRVIGPLIRYDEENNASLIETLDCVIDSKDVGDAATKLFIHVNSVRYRLQRIKSIIGLDFFDNSDKYSIITAFTMYKNKEKYVYQKN